MKPAPYVYHRAFDVDRAVSLLAELGEDAKLLAGGQSLVAMMNFRLARPSALVDVNRIPGLDYLARDGEQLRIGGLTRHCRLEAPPDLQVLDGFAVLRQAARWVGHFPIRARGTFGGSLAHADPTAEWCLLSMLLDAQIIAAGPHGRRTIPAQDFFESFLTTALEPDEMITEVVFPRPAPHAALAEFAQRAGDFAVVAAAVALDIEGSTCRGGRVALGGVDAVPVRVAAAEEVLAGADLTGELFREAAEAAAGTISPGSDVHGSGEYRRKLARTLVARALEEASGT